MSGARRHGSRPWGWWVFEVGEDPPLQESGVEEVRLAELGELTDEEVAAIAERASEAKALIGTPERYTATGDGGKIDFEQRAIELWERVQKALKR